MRMGWRYDEDRMGGLDGDRTRVGCGFPDERMVDIMGMWIWIGIGWDRMRMEIG